MSDFAKAIETVITVHEGVFQKRADDPGNWTPDGQLKGTKFGISAHSFPNEDIEGLTLNRAEELYREAWGVFCGLDDQRVLTKVLDLAVNMQWAGRGPATKILQSAINECGGAVAVDGIYGPDTMTAANAIDPEKLLDALCAQAVLHYSVIEAEKPEMKAWFKNWDGRAAWMPPQEQAA